MSDRTGYKPSHHKPKPGKALPPRTVDLLNNKRDFQAALMAECGRSNKAIIAATGLTPGKIAYRMKLGGVSRMAYRDGTSKTAKAMYELCASLAGPALVDRFEKTFGRQRLP